MSPYQIEQVLCSTAVRPRNVEFEFPPDGLPRNDHWGCGMVNFEHAVESVPPVMRVRPISPTSTDPAIARSQTVSQMSDGTRPPSPLRFENPYLSAGAWELTANAGWVAGVKPLDRADGTSTGSVTADLEALRDQAGPIQQGMVYTAAVQACATSWSREQSPCQTFEYRLTIVEDLQQRYLPLAATGDR